MTYMKYANGFIYTTYSGRFELINSAEVTISISTTNGWVRALTSRDFLRSSERESLQLLASVLPLSTQIVSLACQLSKTLNHCERVLRALQSSFNSRLRQTPGSPLIFPLFHFPSFWTFGFVRRIEQLSRRRRWQTTPPRRQRVLANNSIHAAIIGIPFPYFSTTEP